ncbi:MAG: flagellar hook-associated protein FlgK, partial [Sporomusa sp.]|nr:flagellar hook-associated protein FlgK [Sporomusa sp.]
MRSTFGGLNTVVQGLSAQQMALDTVGHNISNSNTGGYSRQRVNLVTTTPQTIYTGRGSVQLGTGVTTQSITRARDTFVDQQFWKENSSLGYNESTSENLLKIEGIFREPSSTGLQTTLDNFWNAWQSLGTNASDTGMRTVVRQRGVEVVDAIKKAEQQLNDMITDANSVVEITANSINQLTKQIYDLNKQIQNVEGGGTDHANDLRDTRDYLVDQLSKIVKVTVDEDSSGKYNIQASGVTLVSESGYEELKTYDVVDPDYGYVTKKVRTSSLMPFEPGSGELKGVLDSRDSEDFGAKAYLNKLNTASQFLLTEFNQQHITGYGLDNSTGNNFFGDSNTYYTNANTNLATIQANYPSMTKVYGYSVTGTTKG